MLIPRLYELDPKSLKFQEVPPVDLALKESAAILLDHGSHLQVWLGNSLLDSNENGGDPCKNQGGEVTGKVHSFIRACEVHAEALCKGRTPIPDLRIIREGKDDINWILSRIVPSRRDQPIDKKNQLSSQMSADMAAMEKVVERFPQSHELSLYEWCRAANVEPPRQDIARAGSMSGLPRT